MPAVFSTVLLCSATGAQAAPSPAELQQRITRQSAELKALSEEYNDVKERLKQTRADRARHIASLPTLERDRAAAEEAVAPIAAMEYKTAHLRGAAAVLGASDRGAMLARLTSLDHLANTRQDRLTRLTTTRSRYADVKQQLAADEARQDALLRGLADRRRKGQEQLTELYALRREAYGQESETGASYTGPVPSISGKAGMAVRFAYDAIGKPYVFADDGPNGYDCSGLTLAAWRTAGKSLPHNARMQWGVVSHLNRSQLKPGDLVFYTNLSHIGIYVGDNKVIHAPTFGEVVKISSVDMLPIYGYGRVR